MASPRRLPRLRRPAAGHQHRPPVLDPGVPRLQLPRPLVRHRPRRPGRAGRPGDRMTQRTTRAQRLAMPLAREVVRELAVTNGGCVRPVQLRRTDVATGQVEQVLVPCGHTLASVCPSCAERAKTLRAAQCREGWHLEDEPDLTPDPATDDQQWWVTMRAEAQQSRDQAEAAGQDTLDFDELIRELDEEIDRSGGRA